MKAYYIFAAAATLSLLSACGHAPSADAASTDNAVAAADQGENTSVEVSPGSSPAELAAAARSAIERTLRADAATATYGYSLDRGQAMRAVDLAGTPSEFRVAYLDHIYAWERLLKAKAAWKELTKDENTGPVLVGGIICGFLDCERNPISDRLDAENRIKTEEDSASAEISDTFRRVETIATSYGATLPVS